METLTLDVSLPPPLTDEVMYRPCISNRELRIERTRDGQFVLMPPRGGETGARSLRIQGPLFMWNEQTRAGIVFDSSTGFLISSRAMCSPDAAAAEWLA